MTISAVGAAQQAGATGGDVESLSVTMGSLAVGDILLLGSVELFSGEVPRVEFIAGGGVTEWIQGADSLAFDAAGYHAEVWYGFITSLTPAEVRVNYASGAGAFVATARIACQQFHSSASGTLTLITFGGDNSDTLPPAASGTYFELSGDGLYFACGLFNTAVSGSTPGFTYLNGIGGGTGGAVVWNAAASGPQDPAWDQGSSGVWGTCAALFSVVTTPTSQVVMMP